VGPRDGLEVLKKNGASELVWRFWRKVGDSEMVGWFWRKMRHQSWSGGFEENGGLRTGIQTPDRSATSSVAIQSSR